MDETEVAVIRKRGKVSVTEAERLRPGECEIKELFFGFSTPQVVQVTFQMDFRDWLKPEVSALWRQMEKVLGDVQRE